MKMKKIFIAISASVVLLLGLLVGVSVYVASLLTEEFIVHQLEEIFNARFDLKKYTLSVLSGGDLKIQKFSMGPRDRYANNGVPLAKRPPLKNTAISMEELGLHLDIFKLIDGIFSLEGFVLKKPKIQLVLYANNRNNLSSLFTSPAIVNGRPNQAKKQNEASSNRGKEEKVSDKRLKKSGTLKAQSVPIAASLGEIGIKGGYVNVLLKKTGDSIRIENLNLLVKNIEFDPKDLKNKNSADIFFDMELRLFTKSKKETGLFLLSSNGRVVPFNQRSGRLDPNVVYSLLVEKGSYVAGFSVLEKLSGQLDLLKKANISLDQLKEKAVLSANSRLKLRYYRDVVSFLRDASLLTKHFDLFLKKGTLFRLTQMTHRMKGELLLSPEISKETIAGIDKNLQKQLKMNPKETVETRNKAFQDIIRGDRIFLSFQSQGSIQSPSVSLHNKLPSISNLLEEAGKQYFRREKEKGVSKAVDKLKKEGEKLLQNLF